jgi:hypothetical protein
LSGVAGFEPNTIENPAAHAILAGLASVDLTHGGRLFAFRATTQDFDLTSVQNVGGWIVAT